MKQRPRIHYSQSQKAVMWKRWSEGATLHEIAKLFDRGTRLCTESWQSRVASNDVLDTGHPEHSAWPNERRSRVRQRGVTRSAASPLDCSDLLRR
jgi:hypothetical protein